MAAAISRDPGTALRVHTREELGVDPHDLPSPLLAGAASLLAFSFGALIPLLPYLLGFDVLAATLVITAVALVTGGRRGDGRAGNASPSRAQDALAVTIGGRARPQLAQPARHRSPAKAITDGGQQIKISPPQRNESSPSPGAPILDLAHPRQGSGEGWDRR